MAQPYTIRLDQSQVDALTQSGSRTLRDGISQLLAAAAMPPPPAGEPTHPPPASGGHTITITVKID